MIPLKFIERMSFILSSNTPIIPIYFALELQECARVRIGIRGTTKQMRLYCHREVPFLMHLTDEIVIGKELYGS